MTYDQLCGEARLQVALAKMQGCKFDKSITRYNDIAQTAIRYAACLGHEVLDRRDIARTGLLEAVESCIIGSDFYIPGKGPLSLVPDWMISGATR